MAADKDTIWRAMIEIGTCMLVTKEGDFLRARPMQALPEPDENTVWFLTDRQAEEGKPADTEEQVCLAFADVEDDLYVSVSGTLAKVEDAHKVNTLLADEAEDEDAPIEAHDLVALRFTPVLGEIWDGWSLGDDDDAEDTEESEASESSSIKIDFSRSIKGDA